MMLLFCSKEGSFSDSTCPRNKHFGIKIYKPWDETGYTYNSLFFPSCRWGNFTQRLSIGPRDILEKIARVGRHEQHSTKAGLSQSVTVTQPKSSAWPASGGKRHAFSEVWRTYDVCVVGCFWHYHATAQLQSFWGWNFLCKRGARNRNVSKIN